MQYHWREGSRFPHTADAQAVGEWFAAQPDTSLTGLWEAGKRRGTPIHKLLTWDKDKALDLVQRREIQTILSLLRITRRGTEVRAFLRVKRDGVSHYRPYEQVMRNSELREQRLQLAYRQMASLRAQWGDIPELQDVLAVLDKHATVEV